MSATYLWDGRREVTYDEAEVEVIWLYRCEEAAATGERPESMRCTHLVADRLVAEGYTRARAAELTIIASRIHGAAS